MPDSSYYHVVGLFVIKQDKADLCFIISYTVFD